MSCPASASYRAVREFLVKIPRMFGAVWQGNQSGVSSERVQASMRFSLNGKCGRLTYFMLALAMFVFLFALHAKISLYQPGPSAQSSKLWLNGQKMDVLSSIESAGSVLLGLLAVILFAFSPLLRRLRPIRWAYVAPTPFLIDPFQRSRFLRPPPTF